MIFHLPSGKNGSFWHNKIFVTQTMLKIGTRRCVSLSWLPPLWKMRDGQCGSTEQQRKLDHIFYTMVTVRQEQGCKVFVGLAIYSTTCNVSHSMFFVFLPQFPGWSLSLLFQFWIVHSEGFQSFICCVHLGPFLTFCLFVLVVLFSLCVSWYPCNRVVNNPYLNWHYGFPTSFPSCPSRGEGWGDGENPSVATGLPGLSCQLS